MDKILNKCPICGARLEYSVLMQFSKDYQIKLNGRLSKNSKNSDVSPIESWFHKAVPLAISILIAIWNVKKIII